MDKKKVLIISGLINIVIFIAVLINIIIVFPLTPESSWVYGTYIIAAGIVTYITGLYLVEGFKVELIGSTLIVIGEIFVLFYFNTIFPFLGTWISYYVIIPSVSFLLLMVVAFIYNKDELDNKKALNLSFMLTSGSFFFFMVEAAIRIPDFFGSNQIPIWGFILIAGGLMVYGFTTWKIFEGGNYIMALTGAFIVNIGVLMIELFYRIHEITGIFTIIFIPPGLVFFLLIFINYKISPHD
jgi:hypothetical protein